MFLHYQYHSANASGMKWDNMGSQNPGQAREYIDVICFLEVGPLCDFEIGKKQKQKNYIWMLYVSWKWAPGVI